MTTDESIHTDLGCGLNNKVCHVKELTVKALHAWKVHVLNPSLQVYKIHRLHGVCVQLLHILHSASYILHIHKLLSLKLNIMYVGCQHFVKCSR